MLRMLLIFCLAGGLAMPTQAQYALHAERAGAGHATMSGGSYALQGSAGQPAIRIAGDDPYIGAGFWYAARNANVALPVELVTFEAIGRAEAVVLAWETATETNNAGFEIQRAVASTGSSAPRWVTLHFVEGAGTTSQSQTYRYTDDALPHTAETLVYRLKQIDTDGAFTYSDDVEVTRAAPQRLALHPNYPNPFRGQTTIRYALPKAGPVQLTVFDLMGRRVATLVDDEQSAGRKEVIFQLQRLASGVYFARLQAGSRTITQKMTVVR